MKPTPSLCHPRLAPSQAMMAALVVCAAAVAAVVAVAPSVVTAEPATPPRAVPKPPAAAPRTAINAPVKQEPAPAKPAAGKAKSSKSGSGQSIVVLVNDEPITAYEVERRQKFMALSFNIGPQAQQKFQQLIKAPETSEKLKAILNETITANKGKSKDEIIALFEVRKKKFAQSLQEQAVNSSRAGILPGLKTKALDELIDERLKLQEAKRLNVLAGDEDVSRVIKGMAERNKMNEEQFATHLKGLGTNISTMQSRMRATLSWNDVIRRKFGHQIAISERDVDRFVAKAPDTGEDTVELQLHRITMDVPAKIEQKVVAQRLQDADSLRAKFSGCTSTAAISRLVAGARFDDLGSRLPSSLPEPTRSLLLNAKDGEILPAAVGAGGIELWVVCGRKPITANEQKRTAAQDELRQKEFEVLAKRALKDLRQDALIEYR